MLSLIMMLVSPMCKHASMCDIHLKISQCHGSCEEHQATCVVRKNEGSCTVFSDVREVCRGPASTVIASEPVAGLTNLKAKVVLVFESGSTARPVVSSTGADATVV